MKRDRCEKLNKGSNKQQETDLGRFLSLHTSDQLDKLFSSRFSSVRLRGRESRLIKSSSTNVNNDGGSFKADPLSSHSLETRDLVRACVEFQEVRSAPGNGSHLQYQGTVLMTLGKFHYSI